MILGIDASSAAKANKTGVEWYAYQLIEQFKTRPLAQGERVRLYAPGVLPPPLGEMPAGWETAVLPWNAPGWMRVRMGWEMFRRAPDVLFVPAQGLPAFPPRGPEKATITTVHDVAFRRLPGLYDPAARRRLESATARALKLATRILTVSEFSRQEIAAAFRYPADRITVTPLAPHAAYRPHTAEEVNKFRARYRVGPHYFLCIGRLEHRKNQLTLVRAFDQFKQRRGIGDPFELVLVGPDGFGAADVRRYAAAVPSAASIRFIPYLETDAAAALMAGATAFAFPSVYEGFGIPALEALAAGTPLLAADIPPLREAAGDAALYVSPKEMDAWIEAFQRVATDASFRAALREKGLERVKQFSWQKTAELTWHTLHL